MKFDLTAILPTSLKPYAKYVYAVLTVAAFLVAQGIVTGDVAEWVTRIVGFVGITGSVYSAENRDSDPGIDEQPAQDEFEDATEVDPTV